MRKLSVILAIVTGFCMSITLLVVTTLLNQSSIEAIDEEASKYLELMAVHTGKTLEEIMEDVELQVDAFTHVVAMAIDHGEINKIKDAAYFDRVMPALKDATLQYAQTLQNNYDFYVVFRPELTENVEDILLVRENDQYVHKEGLLTRANLVDGPDMAWLFSPLKKGEGVWSGPYHDSILNMRLMSYSSPIYLNDQIIGIVGLDIEFDYFEQIVNDVTIYETGYALLLNEEYGYMVHPFFTKNDKLSTVEGGIYAYMIDEMKDKDVGVLKYHFQETDKILAFYRLSNGWIFSVAPPYNEAFENLEHTKSNNSIIILIGVLFSIMIMSFVSYRFTKPIDTLTSEISVIGQGQLNNAIDGKSLNSQTEIGVLAQTVEKMRVDLKGAFDNIHEQNETLDIRVQERTEELFAVNQELVASMEALEDMQAKFIASEKKALARTMISNIVHRLNTPIGTSVTMITYLKHVKNNQEDQSNAEYQKSLDLLLSTQLNMREVIDQMRLYLDPYDDTNYHEFDIVHLVNLVVQETLSTSQNDNLNIQVVQEGSSKAYQSQKLINRLSRRLLDYSRKLEKSDQRHIRLSLDVTDQAIHLCYKDEGMVLIGDLEKLFEPYHIHSFKEGQLGLELSLIGDLVSRGLQGQIHLVEDDDEGQYIKITIPQVKV